MLTHYYQTIPNYFDWPELYAQIVAEAQEGDWLVETGTLLGASAACMGVEIANSGKPLVFHTWDNGSGVETSSLIPWTGEDLFARAAANLAPVRPWVQIRRGSALEAWVNYAHESLRLVWLDDCHETAHLLAEMLLWWPKVQPGGLLGGHDLDWKTVERAVRCWEQVIGLTVSPMGRRSWGVRKP